MNEMYTSRSNAPVASTHDLVAEIAKREVFISRQSDKAARRLSS
jgi:hypothetical protein